MMAGIERIHIQSDWGNKEQRCKESQDLEPTADEIYRNLFANISMPLEEGEVIHECTKDDAISKYDWKDGIDLLLHTKTGHTLTIQEKLLKKIYSTATFTEKQGAKPGNWYTSIAHYWFVGYAYNYPDISFDQWILIDLPCLKRLDHQLHLNWEFRPNKKPGYEHIWFRYIEFDDIPSDAVIARF